MFRDQVLYYNFWTNNELKHQCCSRCSNFTAADFYEFARDCFSQTEIYINKTNKLKGDVQNEIDRTNKEIFI